MFPLPTLWNFLQASFILISSLETGPTVYYSSPDILCLCISYMPPLLPALPASQLTLLIYQHLIYLWTSQCYMDKPLYYFFSYIESFLYTLISSSMPLNIISAKICPSPHIYIFKPPVSVANIASFLKFSFKITCIRISLYQLSWVSSSQFSGSNIFLLIA